MMKPIAVNQLSDNFFETISKEWMLVTAGNKDAFNTMTANWGGIGFLWNKPVVYVFIRPERYTFDFMEENVAQRLKMQRKPSLKKRRSKNRKWSS